MSLTLFLDLETYCELNLKDVGAYRYAAHPSFEITLMSYSFNGKPATVLEGEDDIAEMLLDVAHPDITKVAHNAQFDRVALSSLGRRRNKLEGDGFYPPSQWHDTMAEAAAGGYPRKLDMLAKRLRTTPKDSAGTHLINYFAKPYKGRRRTKADDPDRWAQFVEYARQDTDTLVEIYHKLDRLNDREHAIWVLDQEINDRGIRVDMPLARWAEEQHEINSERASAKLSKILDVDNANSVHQVKAGLESIGLKLKNLQSATVEETLERDDLTKDQRTALELRQEISLSAAKKYTAAISMSNDDHRFRGGFSYHGAITGRWCLTGDHEVLTPHGWQRIDEWGGGQIASWSPDEQISFQHANQVSFDYDGQMYEYDSTRIKQVSTPDHKMPVVSRKSGAVESVTVEDMAARRNYVPIRGTRRTSAKVVDPHLRVLVMVQADGHFNKDGTLILKFSKDRKTQRSRKLLRDAEIPYTETTWKDGSTSLKIPKRVQPMWLVMFRDKEFGSWLWDTNPTVFFDELVRWDGHSSAPNSYQYTTTSKQNADMIQAFAHLSGLFARVLEKHRDVEGWSTAYIVNIWLSAPQGHELRDKPNVTHYSGEVYCAETQTGYFLVRRNGSVWVTGNSGRGLQLQNLPRAEIKYPEAAVLDSQLGLGASAHTLKAMVRPMLLGPFVVSDFAAIEARVLAWIAGEQWALEAFRNGRDIYVETAQRMGGLSRQQGKVAVLALGYAGGVKSLRSMGAQGTDEELDQIKSTWRKANRNIARIWKELDEAFTEGSGTVGSGRVAISKKGKDRYIHLPSGRALVYRNVRRAKVKKTWPDGETSIVNALHFQGDYGPVQTYGGKLAENVTQAIARDLLADSMLDLDRRGMRIVGHVHDEIIIEDPDHEVEVEEVERLMSKPPKWAKDLPLGAEGFRTFRYRKG